ncbi:MAG: DNA repair protein [Gammaproteobacteria bacterium HGW-Gammaproteobacteria-9]|nr:MAG: DNA repair protein [Gammaproteobacteria bacterium HGW-Gammaproteobacteria-9]
MAKFLNTSATNYYLEEMIKTAKDRLILISPFLRLNERIKELLEDKDRLKIDVRIVYGKSELQPEEVNWLKGLSYIRTSRISDEVRISLEVVAKDSEPASETDDSTNKLTSSKMAQKLGLKTPEFLEKLLSQGLLELRDGKNYLTDKGKEAGGEFRMSPKFGPYFLWPVALDI